MHLITLQHSFRDNAQFAAVTKLHTNTQIIYLLCIHVNYYNLQPIIQSLIHKSILNFPSRNFLRVRKHRLITREVNLCDLRRSTTLRPKPAILSEIPPSSLRMANICSTDVS